MGHRAFIIRDGKAVYSHWGAALTHEPVRDWQDFVAAVADLLARELARGGAEAALDDVQAFIDEQVEDVCCEAVFHLHGDTVTAYVPVWMFARDEKGLAVFKLESAPDWRLFRRAQGRLANFASAYSFVKSIDDPVGLAYENGLRDPFTRRPCWDTERRVCKVRLPRPVRGGAVDLFEVAA